MSFMKILLCTLRKCYHMLASWPYGLCHQAVERISPWGVGSITAAAIETFRQQCFSAVPLEHACPLYSV